MPSKFDQFPLRSFGHIPDLGHCQKFYFPTMWKHLHFSGNPPQWLSKEGHQQLRALRCRHFLGREFCRDFKPRHLHPHELIHHVVENAAMQLTVAQAA
jgi:hypothetical protein